MNKKLEKIQELQNEVSKWSDSQFDNGMFIPSRSIPISKHLQKESKELTEAIENYFKTGRYDNVMEELADVFILLLDVSCHIGSNVDALVTSAYNKLEINKSRKWGLPDKEGIVEHIK